MNKFEEYLGDGAYVEFDGLNFVIYTSDGFRRTNQVFLDPFVLISFKQFVKRVEDSIRELQQQREQE